MNCWIGVEHKNNRRIIRVAGEFNRQQVPELLTFCRVGDDAVEIDLSDLVSADAAGIEALRRLREGGTTLVLIPGYIALKLDAAPPSSD